MDNKSAVAEVSYERASLADAREIVCFHNEYYGNRRLTSAWKWEFSDLNPDRFVYWVIKSEGRIVGTQAMIPIDLRYEGKLIPAAKSESTLLDPDFRGGGRLQKLYSLAIDDCISKGTECIWGFTNQKAAFERLGFQVTPNCATWVAPGRNLLAGVVGKLSDQRSLLRRAGSAVRLAKTHLARPRLEEPPQRASQKTIKTITPTEFDSFWSRYCALRPGQIELEHDTKYCKWRWSDNPNTVYRDFAIRDEAENITAWIQTCISSGNFYVADALFLDISHAVELLTHVFDTNRSKVAELRLFMNPESVSVAALTPMLNRYGFERTSDMHFVLRILSEKLKPLAETQRWNFSFAWTEGYEA